ncbi:hypothetical protein DPEC_G00360380 [Dallia pectoralis]|uniref:Uncharacterized protein n=1 Tax=Dallia pectoralis TaxID=75939 RepID=A0ACC2F0R9_DALPE|nr:hypothetical protein DPEC_G00360380 [Dallia pectoralis]
MFIENSQRDGDQEGSGRCRRLPSRSTSRKPPPHCHKGGRRDWPRLPVISSPARSTPVTRRPEAASHSVGSFLLAPSLDDEFLPLSISLFCVSVLHRPRSPGFGLYQSYRVQLRSFSSRPPEFTPRPGGRLGVRCLTGRMKRGGIAGPE